MNGTLRKLGGFESGDEEVVRCLGDHGEREGLDLSADGCGEVDEEGRLRGGKRRGGERGDDEGGGGEEVEGRGVGSQGGRVGRGEDGDRRGGRGPPGRGVELLAEKKKKDG